MPSINDLPWREIASDTPGPFDSSEWTRRIEHELWDDGEPERLTELLQRHAAHCIRRLRAVERQLCSEFVGKGEVIRMMIVSGIAQQPMLLVGPPGVAKSKLVSRFCELLGVTRTGEAKSRPSSFQYLIHSFTDPSEILGIINLEALRGSPPRFQRVRAGSITDAEVSFLDEVFHANSALLNTLLSIINERRVYEGGEAQPVKTRLIYGASNSVPTPRQMSELAAFYSRFTVRVETAAIPHGLDADGEVPAARQQLLQAGWRGQLRELHARLDASNAQQIPPSCLNDVLLLHRAAAELWGGQNLDHADIRAFVMLFHQLVAELSSPPVPKVNIDDRRFIKLFSLARAHALFVHNDRPRAEDLNVLKHCWDDPTQKDGVWQTVEDFIRRQGRTHVDEAS